MAGTDLTRHFPAMASADYRALWMASGASAVSMWMMIMARAWLALELADSGVAVGVVTFAAMAPWTLAPIAGAMADRFDRARMATVARVLQMIFALILAWLALGDGLALWHLILFAALSGMGWSLEAQAQNALLPNTVDPGSLLNAITLVSLANFGSRLVGPLVGAPMLAGVGAGWIFVMAAGFYALSALLTSRVRLRSKGGLAGSKSLFRDAGRGLQEALRYVGENPQIRLIIAVVALHCLLTMSFDALLPILARDAFDGGTSLFSAMLMGIGAGALVGTLGLSFVRNNALRGRLFFATGLLSGATMVWTGLAPNEAWVVAGAAATGASQAMFVALSATLIQSVLPDGIRGRVMSLYALFAGGVMAFMILSNGSASDIVSVRVLLWAPGLLFVVLLLGWVFVHADLRRVIDRGVLYLGREPDPELVGVAAGGD